MGHKKNNCQSPISTLLPTCQMRKGVPVSEWGTKTATAKAP